MLLFIIQTIGGAGYQNMSGGGSGGRIAVYWSKRDWWFGQLQSYGGFGLGNGAAGTVYLEVRLQTPVLEVTCNTVSVI